MILIANIFFRVCASKFMKAVYLQFSYMYYLSLVLCYSYDGFIFHIIWNDSDTIGITCLFKGQARLSYKPIRSWELCEWLVFNHLSRVFCCTLHFLFFLVYIFLGNSDFKCVAIDWMCIYYKLLYFFLSCIFCDYVFSHSNIVQFSSFLFLFLFG